MNQISFNRLLSLGIASILFFLILIAGVSFSSANRTDSEVDGLTQDHLPHLVLAQNIFNEVNTIARALRNVQVIGQATPEDLAKAKEEWERVNISREKIDKLLAELEEKAKEINDQEAFDDLKKIRDKQPAFLQSLSAYKTAFDSGDVTKSRSLLLGDLRNNYNAFRDPILAMAEQEQHGALAAAKEIKSVTTSSEWKILVTALCGISLSIVVALILLRRVKRQLGGQLEWLQTVVQRIADGDLSQDIQLNGAQENSLLAQMRGMQLKLREAAKLAEENARVRTALESVTTCVMIADADRKITYCNAAQHKMLRDAENDLRNELPQFSADSVIGTSIDSFHKNPAHQQNMLAKLTGTHKAQISIGRRKFSLTINPVLNRENRHTGYVVEWLDQTEILAQMEREKILSDERARILGALDSTSTNVMLADENRTIIYMNKAVTAMLTRVESELRKVLPSFNVGKLIGSSMDDFHRNPNHQASILANLNQTYRSQISVAGQTFLLIANPVFDVTGKRLGSVVEWVDRTAEVLVENEVNAIVEAAANGDFSRRINPAGKEGFMLKLAQGMNQMVGASEAAMSDVARVLGALAQGDLTQKITADYHGLLGELKNDCNATSEKLAEIVLDIQDAAGAINIAAQEIAAGNSNLSSRTEQQAASLEETASSMEELTSTVKQNAENARQANQLAIGASDIAIKGGDVVGQVVSTMSDINESAKKIVDIIAVIDGIAFQTNILALNAAVEAARAGEQGRGFAVVASEVRNLAQRSAGAAKEIKNLIGDSVVKVEAGSKLVDQAGHTMQDVVSAVRRVTDIMSEISAASNEQSAGIEQVNQAITHMDENTQQNAALVEQAAAAAESLEEQAHNLTQTVGIFKLAGASRMTSNLAARPKLTASIPSKPASSLGKPAKRSVPNLGNSDGDWEEF